jgi:glycosyltransferase involved in cell wall biosynthesis
LLLDILVAACIIFAVLLVSCVTTNWPLDKVTFPAKVAFPPADISKAKAVLSPSLWEDPGAVMIEAAFCNKIVISSDCISGPKEFLLDGKGGYLFKNNNLNSFVKTINDFLQDNNHNILLKKINAKKNSKKYTLFNHFKQLDALLC